MAVSDPILKELKAHLLSLMKCDIIKDDSLDLLSLCDCLERIFLQGFCPQNYILGLAKRYDPWKLFLHLASISDIQFGFQSSVEQAKKCKKVQTYQGKLRMCIRCLLMKKCIHVPVQYLLNNMKLRHTFYNMYSILGNEILCEMFFSLLISFKNLNFKLDFNNSRFLDETWLLPNTARIMLVPCTELGISVAFVDSKAIIMNLIEGSVASECGNFQVGDILDEINDMDVYDCHQGILRSIVKKNQGTPVTALIIKAHLSDSLYPPLVPLLKSVGLDPSFILSGKKSKENDESATSVTYLGCELTGKRSDVKQIQTSIVRMLNNPLKQSNIQVRLEAQELGVLVKHAEDSSILYCHKYMQISSCGRTVNNPQYFGYIVENIDIKEFECHMFYCPHLHVTDNILQSIGQGFKRTHFAV